MISQGRRPPGRAQRDIRWEQKEERGAESDSDSASEKQPEDEDWETQFWHIETEHEREYIQELGPLASRWMKLQTKLCIRHDYKRLDEDRAAMRAWHSLSQACKMFVMEQGSLIQEGLIQEKPNKSLAAARLMTRIREYNHRFPKNFAREKRWRDSAEREWNRKRKSDQQIHSDEEALEEVQKRLKRTAAYRAFKQDDESQSPEGEHRSRSPSSRRSAAASAPAQQPQRPRQPRQPVAQVPQPPRTVPPKELLIFRRGHPDSGRARARGSVAAPSHHRPQGEEFEAQEERTDFEAKRGTCRRLISQLAEGRHQRS